MCFLWISEQTAIISIYSINWLAFITETECVYCAARSVYMGVIQVNRLILVSEVGFHPVNIISTVLPNLHGAITRRTNGRRLRNF